MPSTSEPKSHHVLPRFYLGGFCDKEVHAREDHERDRSRCRVWTYDRKQGRVRERGIKKLSTRRHYYSADAPDGARDTSPEKILAGVEDRAARIIRGLAYGTDLSPGDKSELALFAALMKTRVSGYRAWVEDYARESVGELRERVFPSVEDLGRSLREDGLAVGDDDAAVERMYRDIHSGTRGLEVPRNHMLEFMFSTALSTHEVLLGQTWVFAWTTSEDHSFATSDNPFLVLDRNLRAPEGFVGEVGVESPGSTKVLPLTQDVCLLVRDGPPHVGHGRLEPSSVRMLNEEQTRHYEGWLIARDEALVKGLVAS